MPDYKDVCSGPSTLSHDDRAKIVSRIHSLLYWVGEMIPQEIVVDGRTVLLRDAVFNYLMSEDPAPEVRKDAELLATFLEAKEKELEMEIKVDDINRSEACELMNEARSYLRAVDELRHSKGEEGEIKRHDLMKRVEDAKRWHKFMKDAV